MADVEYILGTESEYIRLELEADAPGFTFVASEWTAKVAICAIDEVFDADKATWIDATLETVDGHDYVLILAGTAEELDPEADRYKVFIRPVKTSDGVERPTIRAIGTVTFKPG